MVRWVKAADGVQGQVLGLLVLCLAVDLEVDRATRWVDRGEEGDLEVMAGREAALAELEAWEVAEIGRVEGGRAEEDPMEWDLAGWEVAEWEVAE